MCKKRWLKWSFVLLLLVAVWHKDKAFKWLEAPKPATGINIGVLVDDKELSGDKAQDVALAETYLSADYQWVYVPDECNGKIPLPWPPFTESTGFHFRPISKKHKDGQQLMARR